MYDVARNPNVASTKLSVFDKSMVSIQFHGRFLLIRFQNSNFPPLKQLHVYFSPSVTICHFVTSSSHVVQVRVRVVAKPNSTTFHC